MNIPLIIYDLLILPLIIIRIIIIYFCGAKYNIYKCKFLDVIMHANNPYFNQKMDVPTVDILNTDVRTAIKEDTLLFNDNSISKNENVVNIIDTNTEIEIKRCVDDALTELTETSQ